MSRRTRSYLGSPTPTHIRKLLRTARDAAELAGRFVARRHRSGGQTLRRKGVGDFVTDVDLATEMLLRRHILRTWPDHGVLGEEHAAQNLLADTVWVLDPIDGTSNFGRGLPIFAVSVACLHQGRPIATALHCFPEGVTYSAGLGLGAFGGRQRLKLARRRLDDAAILGVQWHRGARDLTYLGEIVATGTRVRNLGCTVVQLCDVAAGRLDGNVQEQGKLWDFAAAALVVMEAGGHFTDWEGKDIFPVPDYSGARHYPSIAGHPAVHRELCAILGPWLGEVAVPLG